jgi:hypothetical protein
MSPDTTKIRVIYVENFIAVIYSVVMDPGTILNQYRGVKIRLET